VVKIVAATAPLHASTATVNLAVNLPERLVRILRTIRPSCVLTVRVTTIPGLNAEPRSARGFFDTRLTEGAAAAAGTAMVSTAAVTARRRSVMP